MLSELRIGLLAIFLLIAQGRCGPELKKWQQEVKQTEVYKPINIVREIRQRLKQFPYGNQYSSQQTVITEPNGDQYIINRIYKCNSDSMEISLHKVTLRKEGEKELVQTIIPEFNIKGENYREENPKAASIVDMNFDGYEDILLIDYGNTAPNYGRYVWFYNSITHQFEYNSILSEFLIKTGANYNEYERTYKYEVSRLIPNGMATSYYKAYWQEGKINEVLDRKYEKYYDVTTNSIIENNYKNIDGNMLLQSHYEEEFKYHIYIYQLEKGDLEENGYVTCNDVYMVMALTEKGTKPLEVTFNYKKGISYLKAESIEIREIGGDFYQKLTDYVNQERGDGHDEWRYGLSIKDWNGDGKYDIATYKFLGGSNCALPRVIWLWDSSKEQYVYNKFLSDASESGSLSISEEGKIQLFIRNGGGEHEEIEYEWKDNELHPISYKYTHDEGKVEEWVNVTEVYKIVNGEKQLIETRINE